MGLVFVSMPFHVYTYETPHRITNEYLYGRHIIMHIKAYARWSRHIRQRWKYHKKQTHATLDWCVAQKPINWAENNTKISTMNKSMTKWMSKVCLRWYRPNGFYFARITESPSAAEVLRLKEKCGIFAHLFGDFRFILRSLLFRNHSAHQWHFYRSITRILSSFFWLRPQSTSATCNQISR